MAASSGALPQQCAAINEPAPQACLMRLDACQAAVAHRPARHALPANAASFGRQLAPQQAGQDRAAQRAAEHICQVVNIFERILVPLDGSALAECVLPHVVAMSRAFGSEVILSGCWSSPHRAGPICRSTRCSGILIAPNCAPILTPSWRAESALPAATIATILSQHHGARLILARMIIVPEMARRTPITGDDARLIREVTESNRREVAAYLEQLCARMPFETQARILTGESVAGVLHDLIRQDDIDWRDCQPSHRLWRSADPDPPGAAA